MRNDATLSSKVHSPRNARDRGIPKMRFINGEVPIVKVAAALDLRFDTFGKIHCWHPDRHKNGDRTASVGVRATNNTVKCFGCDSKPMGPEVRIRQIEFARSCTAPSGWARGRAAGEPDVSATARGGASG